jgi:methyltransferase-like protein
MFHDDRSLPPTERVARARAFADRLSSAGLDTSKIFELILADEANAIRKQGDAHLLHEQLEAFNQPLYFAEFARRASVYGLQFLSESKLFLSGWEAEAAAKKAAGTDDLDPVRLEQYIDIVRGGTFRMTLLCHESHSVHRVPSCDAIPELFFVGTSVPEKTSREDRAKGGEHAVTFKSRQGTTMTTSNPVVAAMLRTLIRVSPHALPFSQVVSLVSQRLEGETVPGLPGADRQVSELESILPPLLLECARAGLVDVDGHPPAIRTEVSARTRASAIARARAEGTGIIPTLLHGRITVGAPERFLLARLDGTRTAADLLADLESATERGDLTWDKGPPTRDVAVSAIDGILKFFATCALLEA